MPVPALAMFPACCMMHHFLVSRKSPHAGPPRGPSLCHLWCATHDSSVKGCTLPPAIFFSIFTAFPFSPDNRSPPASALDRLPPQRSVKSVLHRCRKPNVGKQGLGLPCSWSQYKSELSHARGHCRILSALGTHCMHVLQDTYNSPDSCSSAATSAPDTHSLSLSAIPQSCGLLCVVQAQAASHCQDLRRVTQHSRAGREPLRDNSTTVSFQGTVRNTPLPNHLRAYILRGVQLHGTLTEDVYEYTLRDLKSTLETRCLFGQYHTSYFTDTISFHGNTE